MKFIYAFITILYLTCFVPFNGNKDVVKVEVIKQTIIKNNTHMRLYNREITLRITNNSTQNVFIRGNQIPAGFFPTGFFAKYDGYKKEWETPFKENNTPSFDDLNIVEFDTKKLEPNESFTFTGLLPPTDPKIQYKRIMYVSIKEANSTPEIFESPLFAIENSEDIFN